MKQILAILLTATTLSCQLNAQNVNERTKELYPIIENELWGYIDSLGKVIVEPKFRSAGQFSEGLAPVRLNGTYGYIDQTGDFVIQPKYDVAYSFQKGQAKVYINGKPYYINLEGKITFEHNFSEIHGFGTNDFSIVITKAENYGIINREGQFLVDTIYKRIRPFSDELSIVSSRKHETYPNNDKVNPTSETGVINSKGEIIVPFGDYKSISPFRNGYAKVELFVERQNGYYDHKGVIDSSGKLRFVVPAKKWHFDYGSGHFSEGLATVDIYSVDPDTVEVWSSNDRFSYKGVINSEGNIIFSNDNWEEITPFSNNRAFVKTIDEDWYLINRKGQILNQHPYQEILYETYGGNSEYLFQNGIQLVETEKGWGAIDTMGKYVVEPKDIGFGYRDLYWRGKIVFIKEDISVDSDKYSYRYGFWNISTGQIINPQFHDINFSEFTEDLIYVMEDDRMGYIDKQGNYVWREKKIEQVSHGGVNIDYMNRGYFYASSPYKEELAGFGGWGGSGNDFKLISNSTKFKNGKLNMIVNPLQREKYWQKYDGMKMYVANTSQDTIFFKAQDSRLYLKIQAQDKNGEWKDIEYLPSSWCGNSYHSLFLPPNYNWEFVIPKYEGEFNTKLRAELLYRKNKDQKENSVLYSNEFYGSINPGQFWRKTPYLPTGLMDPYYD